ncbi:oxaloacetate decarboxylase [Sulfitobacter pontiacus]|uniref:isocitrate lyase/PEP mutase family protein n=1 Tax=Sulfitobacter pontiacus TaxID=60137 RepID=UPI00044BD980|nr:isocitrate lyase/PEP mutase family protein [Sulfitobacter pontiacus]KAJ30974.1 carboxyvinyl-carboxyphosphonate phosphorylmutase [Sulfitobacter pontiacus 3SOLIMAR09]
MMTKSEMARAIRSGKCLWSAGCHDVLSAKLVQKAGFDVLLTSGFGISASLLGQPDVEVYSMTENLGVVRNVANAVTIPVIADADTGYGNAINVMRTVREFEQAGASAMIIEDQMMPKRCPAVASRLELITIEEGVSKIRAAVAARRDDDTLIIGRTDAETKEESIKRARAYAAAGADMIQPISVGYKNLEDLRELRDACGVPLSLQIMRWLETDLSGDEIESIAGIAHFPLVSLLSATRAMENSLSRVREARTTRALDERDQTSLTDFKHFIGFPEVERMQEEFMKDIA